MTYVFGLVWQLAWLFVVTLGALVGLAILLTFVANRM